MCRGSKPSGCVLSLGGLSKNRPQAPTWVRLRPVSLLQSASEPSFKEKATQAKSLCWMEDSSGVIQLVLSLDPKNAKIDGNLVLRKVNIHFSIVTKIENNIDYVC